MLVLCNFLKILMVSDKSIHKAFRTRKTIWTKPIRYFFFHYLPELYIGFYLPFHIIILPPCSCGEEYGDVERDDQGVWGGPEVLYQDQDRHEVWQPAAWGIPPSIAARTRSMSELAPSTSKWCRREVKVILYDTVHPQTLGLAVKNCVGSLYWPYGL